jgi:hypothetical protein
MASLGRRRHRNLLQIDQRPSKEMPHCTKFHQAIIINKNKILAIAHNSMGSRSRGSGYNTNTIHAEVAVVKSLGDISLLRGATLIVYRNNTMGQLRNSKPCVDCQCFLKKCMDKYGLRKVLYSVEE